ncbi:MAG TPA: hypothetical protein VM308_00645 [Sphingomicrobium sp.]|nr:hypothetical protein [Sphingomicrobium sp.]
MRLLLALGLTVFLAACATAPRPTPQPQQPPAQPEEHSSLSGLTVQELVARFGTPALQIREGNSLKLQFRGRRCVMDTYLYPRGNDGLRVTHVDTRLPSGGDIDQSACIYSLRNRPI